MLAKQDIELGSKFHIFDPSQPCKSCLYLIRDYPIKLNVICDLKDSEPFYGSKIIKRYDPGLNIEIFGTEGFYVQLGEICSQCLLNLRQYEQNLERVEHRTVLIQH